MWEGLSEARFRLVARRRPTLVLKVADGLAGSVEDFERTDKSTRVVPVDVFCGPRIEVLEFAKQFVGRHRFESSTQLLVASGAFKETLPERADVEAGAAADNDGFEARDLR